MTWEKKKILLTVKAYPTESRKYGSTVCAAGITEDGDWIRLYPIPFRVFFRAGNPFKKYTWIEVECRKDTDIMKRKESHKVRDGTIRLLDDSLARDPVDWKGRNRIILPMLSKSIEALEEQWKQDRTSLGLIKPKRVKDLLLKRKDVGDDPTIQLDLSGDNTPIADPREVNAQYVFRCGDKQCTGHRILCEDWELGQSWRDWKEKYGSGKVLESKIRERYLDYMIRERDLYFYMGTYYMGKNWLIIGIYYPPKGLD